VLFFNLFHVSHSSHQAVIDVICKSIKDKLYVHFTFSSSYTTEQPSHRTPKHTLKIFDR